MFESCDEIRKKINIHLDTAKTTKNAFLKDIARAAYGGSRNIQAKQLNDFQIKKGATAGAASCVYYAAYVYFEKKRIAENEPKGRHRKNMETKWGSAGMAREQQKGFWLGPGESVRQDVLGGYKIIGGR
jgi:hypothetical protein